MAVYCPSFDRSSGMFLALLFLIALVVAGAWLTSHGVERHGTASLSVRSCVEQGGTFEIWHNPATNRQANLCMVNNKFGVAIMNADGSFVTEFIKDKLTRIEQVYQYLTNGGYTPGPLP